jgi:hypothetical protein
MATDPRMERSVEKARTDEAFKLDTPAHGSRLGARVVVPIVIVLVGIVVLVLLFMNPIS